MRDHHVLAPPKFDTPPRLLIVVAPYYNAISRAQIDGATAAIAAAGGISEVIEVPGALEVPTAIRLASRSGRYDGFVALGCVIRGETTHYDTVCNDSSRALTLLGLDGVCIGNGILTVETFEQAVVRAAADGQNKGGGAADAALHLIAIARRFDRRPDAGEPPAGSFRMAGDDTGGTA